MLDLFPYYLVLIVAIVLLIMLANKIKVAYPVLLVLAGLAMSFVPGLPTIQIDPQLIFIIFLPPLIYEAAWSTSWKELWKWRRIVSSFAFVVVFLTSLAVAWVASQFIPGFTLALGFLLGGIVSPPDAVSAGAILKFVKVPKGLESILAGESLLNDAASLIIFRFALIAVSTGQFVLADAALTFGWMVLGGVGIGVAIAFVFFKLHKVLPGDANTDLVLTLVAPYGMYMVAESMHSSGVLSVVSGGLFLAQRRYLFLSAASRLRAINVWESVTFILNGLVFMLIGLDMPQITAHLNGISLLAAIGFGLLITLVLIVSRLASAYGAVIVTMVARNFITVADGTHPGTKGPFLLGWAGMRGVVSLAAALSIPVQLSNGVAFPQRNLILFITFTVILSTLVLQGLTLPYLIRRFNLSDAHYPVPEAEAYRRMHRKLTKASLALIQGQDATPESDYASVARLVRKLEDTNALHDNEGQTSAHKPIYRQLIEQQRRWLWAWNQDPATNEEVVRKHLLRLDLEEERINFS